MTPTVFVTRYRDLSVRQLVEQEVCPPWYLTSTPVLGRCLPFKLNSTDTEDKKEVKIITQLTLNPLRRSSIAGGCAG